MAYTASDLAAVDAAILAIVNGERVVQVKYGDQQTTYSDVDIDKLRGLRATMQSEIAGSSRRRRVTLAKTGKGL